MLQPNPLSDSEASQLAEHLAVLVKSGTPLAPALRAAAAEIPKGNLSSGMLLLADRLEAGTPLDDILAQNPRFLPPHLQQLIVAGARSGNLPEVLLRVVEIDRHSADLRRSMRTALAYPVILLVLWTTLAVFLAIWVAPGLKETLKFFKTSLPLSTQWLFFVSGDVLLRAVAILAAAIPMIVVGLRVSLRPQGWQRLLAEIPLVGPTLLWRGIANWSRLLALLLRQGIPLPASAKLAAEGVDAPLMAINGLRIAKMIESGRSLANSLDAIRGIPPSLVPLVQFGEQHGTLAESLEAAADVFETRVRLRGELLRSILPPLAFILIGLGTLGIASAMVGPLVGLVQDLGSGVSWRKTVPPGISREECERISLDALGIMVGIWLAMSLVVWMRRFVIGAFLTELAGFSQRNPSKLLAAVRGVIRFLYWALFFVILFWVMAGLSGIWGQWGHWFPARPLGSPLGPPTFSIRSWSGIEALAALTGSWAFFLWLATFTIALMVKFRFEASQRSTLLALLAVAVGRGIPLARVARALADERDDKFAGRARRLAMALDQGVRLDVALEKSGIRLPADAVVAVRAGSRNGALPALLRSAADRAAQTGAPIHGAVGRAFYLLILVMTIAGISSYLAVQLLPAILRIFNDFHTDLPPITLSLIRVYMVFGHYGLAILGSALLLAALVYAISRYVGLFYWDPPLVRRFTKPLDEAIVLGALAESVERQQPMDSAIGLLATHYPKSYIRRDLQRAVDHVGQGLHWCDSLNRSRLLPAAESAVLKSAERLGNLPWALNEMAARLRRKFANRLTGWLAIGFPAALIVFASIVLFITAGMIYPLASLILHLS